MKYNEYPSCDGTYVLVYIGGESVAWHPYTKELEVGCQRHCIDSLFWGHTDEWYAQAFGDRWGTWAEIYLEEVFDWIIDFEKRYKNA